MLCTGGSIEVVAGDNGWEAWRLLGVHCEPSVGMREAQVMQQFTSLITKRAKNAAETRKLIAEMDQRAKRVAEVTGADIEPGTRKVYLRVSWTSIR